MKRPQHAPERETNNWRCFYQPKPISAPTHECCAVASQEEKLRKKQEFRDATSIAAKHQALQRRTLALAAVAVGAARLECLRLCLFEGEPYSDEKVANRDTKVWHGATEKGP